MSRVELRFPQEEDGDEFLALTRGSRDFHHPWVSPAVDMAEYWQYLLRCNRDDFRGYFICLRDGGPIVGVANLSQIFWGNFCSAYLGYFVGQAYAGQGYMREGLSLVLDRAFGPLDLHRVEANIQPDNRDSLALVRRLGFTYEGFSRRYLKIAGEWRDHQRWAVLSEDWSRAQGPAPEGKKEGQ